LRSKKLNRQNLLSHFSPGSQLYENVGLLPPQRIKESPGGIKVLACGGKGQRNQSRTGGRLLSAAHPPDRTKYGIIYQTERYGSAEMLQN
jgi:hypothetical protein